MTLIKKDSKRKSGSGKRFKDYMKALPEVIPAPISICSKRTVRHFFRRPFESFSVMTGSFKNSLKKYHEKLLIT